MNSISFVGLFVLAVVCAVLLVACVALLRFLGARQYAEAQQRRQLVGGAMLAVPHAVPARPSSKGGIQPGTTAGCPQCGTPLPDDSPGGHCPRCLLQGALSASPSPGGGGSGPFVAPDPAELAPHFPHLEIQALLGQGGMGAVYRARQVKLDRPVALKILPAEWGRDPAFAERFAREARALARLTHPHIVAVHDFGEAGGHFFLLMEFVDGANVRQLLQSGPLEPAFALSLIPQICDALQYAHEEGVVHRDVKPENILVDRRGRVKIADFGLAKLVGPSRASFTLTGTHQVMGTLDYMAPEQRNRPQEVDHRADIYSLGVVFYEMLTGELPLGRFCPPSQVAAVDGRVDEVVFRSLEREPERRYQHAGEVRSELESLAGPAAGGGQPAVSLLRAETYEAERVQLQVKGPAVMLFLTALAGLLFWTGMGITGLIYYCTDWVLRHDIPLWAAFLIGGGGAAIVLGLSGTIFAGARKLLRFESYEHIIAAITLAILPWSPHTVLGIAAAIWCMVVLNRAEVTAAFAANLRRRGRPGSSALFTPREESPRPTGPVRRRVRSFLHSLRSVFLGGPS